MRVVVSGGAGRVGRFVLEELVAHGHEVTSLDLAPQVDRNPAIHYMLGNVTRPEDVFGVLAYARAEAMIHLAAWSDPGIVPDVRTYADNVGATFTVLNTADTLGLRRLILASSAQVYGFAEHAPVQAPVDETHPLRPLNAYALSKIAGEDAAAYFARRGLNVLSLRIMGARAPQDMKAEIARALERPEQERFLLWTRVDARDIAIGCRQALEAESVDSGVYNLSGAQNVLGQDSADLLARYAPGTERSALPRGLASPFSSAKAQRTFGYQPRYLWSPDTDHWPN